MNKSSLTKYIIGGVIVLAFAAYLIFSNNSSTPADNTPSPITGQPSTSTTDNNTSGSVTMGTTSTSTTNTTSTGTTSGKYKDGTYTGSVADAFYGNLQAVVTIKGGLITDVTFPQAPSGGESSDVSSRALPALKAEAIAAQSANVNIVSGATQDSEAFNQSLAVALAQAKS